MQGVDIGLALSAPLDRQEPIRFECLEMFPNVCLMQAHVCAEPLLAWKTMVVLPCVAKQHGEGQLVASGQILRFEKEIWDLGKAPARGSVRALEDDVSLLENVSDMALGAEFHIGPL